MNCYSMTHSNEVLISPCLVVRCVRGPSLSVDTVNCQKKKATARSYPVIPAQAPLFALMRCCNWRNPDCMWNMGLHYCCYYIRSTQGCYWDFHRFLLRVVHKVTEPGRVTLPMMSEQIQTEIRVEADNVSRRACIISEHHCPGPCSGHFHSSLVTEMASQAPSLFLNLFD